MMRRVRTGQQEEQQKVELLLLYLLYEDALDELNGQGRLTNATAPQNDNLVLQHVVVVDLTDAIKSSDLKDDDGEAAKNEERKTKSEERR